MAGLCQQLLHSCQESKTHTLLTGDEGGSQRKCLLSNIASQTQCLVPYDLSKVRGFLYTV